MIEKTLFVNGINMALNEHENSGDTLILLHCSGGNNEQWHAMLDYFKEDFHLVIPDLRGHGQSSKPTTDYTLETFATDIIEMMKQLEIEQAHIIGSSLGGEVGVALASMQPNLVKSLVCEGAIANNFGPNSFFGDLSSEEITHTKNEILSSKLGITNPMFSSKEALIEERKAFYKRIGLQWNADRKRYVEANITITDDGSATSLIPTHVGLELTKAYFDIKFETYFERINCPVLFLPSEDESKSKVEMDALKTFKALLKDVDVKVIPNSIHAQVMFDHPKALSEAIKKFYNTYFN